MERKENKRIAPSCLGIRQARTRGGTVAHASKVRERASKDTEEPREKGRRTGAFFRGVARDNGSLKSKDENTTPKRMKRRKELGLDVGTAVLSFSHCFLFFFFASASAPVQICIPRLIARRWLSAYFSRFHCPHQADVVRYPSAVHLFSRRKRNVKGRN